MTFVEPGELERDDEREAGGKAGVFEVDRGERVVGIEDVVQDHFT